MAYRSTPHESSKLTPNMMMFGHEINLPIDLMFGIPNPESFLEGPNEYVEDLRSRLETAYEFARCELKKSALRQKNYYDSKVTQYTYTKDEKVWLYQPHRKIGLSPKLQRLWHGPYVILDILGRNLFRVKKIGTTIQKIVHSDNMKPYGMKVSLNEEETKQSLEDKSVDEYDSEESTVSSPDKSYQNTGKLNPNKQLSSDNDSSLDENESDDAQENLHHMVLRKRPQKLC
jgi:hypothetical protein